MFVVVQILFIPLAIIGVVMVAYRQMWTSRKLGVSSTAIEVINGRWSMDVFDVREDAAARGLNKQLPNSSVAGLWLALFPTYLLSRISGRNLFYPRVPIEGKEGLADIMVARTLYFDEILERHKEDSLQFVLLGAGFDTRAYGSMAEGRLRCFELDQKTTQQLKKRSLQQAGIAVDHVTFVEIDFQHDDLIDRLVESGYDSSQKTLFLWEGVTLYLGRSDVDRTLARLKQHAADGSVIVADFYASSFTSGDYAPGMKAAMNTLKLTDEELGFGLDFSTAPEQVLADFIENQGLELGQHNFLGARSKKGPYMVVAEVFVRK